MYSVKLAVNERDERSIDQIPLHASRPVNFGGKPRWARAGVYFHKESEIAGGKARAPPDIIIAMTGVAEATVTRASNVP